VLNDSKLRNISLLSPEMRVVDIGGGANPSPRADYVIDGLEFDQRGALRRVGSIEERVTPERWVTLDLCERKCWPFPDKFFDFATCTHVLEDLRDPIWVCSEIARIAKAGYIEVPSRVVEQSRGVEHPCYAGYYHHRWLVSMEGTKLQFRFKPHSLHVIRAAIVTEVGPNREINPKYANLSFDWQGTFEAEEVLCFDDQDVERELCAFAAPFQGLSDLTVPVNRPWVLALKRWVYFRRLRRAAIPGNW
jgi:hypothetical protein